MRLIRWTSVGTGLRRRGVKISACLPSHIFRDDLLSLWTEYGRSRFSDTERASSTVDADRPLVWRKISWIGPDTFSRLAEEPLSVEEARAMRFLLQRKVYEFLVINEPSFARLLMLKYSPISRNAAEVILSAQFSRRKGSPGNVELIASINPIMIPYVGNLRMVASERDLMKTFPRGSGGSPARAPGQKSP